jgi:ATP/maltotriose-dependent transcriptional regulator MalT
MEYLIIILSLLTLSIITLVFLVVWRDRRDLKLRRVTEEIGKMEELFCEMRQYKKEADDLLAAVKKQTEQAVSRVDHQAKQLRDSVANLEQRLRLSNKDPKDADRPKERQQKYSGKGKPRNFNKKGQTPHPPSSSDSDGKDVKRIDDGEKYAKMMELAKQGLSNQEIAKKLNLGQEEVELVLQIKKKNIS